MDGNRSTYEVYILLAIPERIHSGTVGIHVPKNNHYSIQTTRNHHIGPRNNLYLEVLANAHIRTRSET